MIFKRSTGGIITKLRKVSSRIAELLAELIALAITLGALFSLIVGETVSIMLMAILSAICINSTVVQMTGGISVLLLVLALFYGTCVMYVSSKAFSNFELL